MGANGLCREPFDRGGGASWWIGRVREVLSAGTDASAEECRYCEGEDDSSEGRHTGPRTIHFHPFYSEPASNPIPPWRGDSRTMVVLSASGPRIAITSSHRTSWRIGRPTAGPFEGSILTRTRRHASGWSRWWPADGGTTTRSVRIGVSGASHPLPKPASVRAGDSQGRWSQHPRLVRFAVALKGGTVQPPVPKDRRVRPPHD